MPIIQIPPKKIVISKKFQGICKKPFYGHPKGCPNFGKKEDCPPNQPLINHVLDFTQPIYVIHTPFAVGEFAETMKTRHPTWTPRQIYNPRLWQPTARKNHRLELERFVQEHPEAITDSCPEARGVNITELMREIGINLDWQWPPQHNVANVTYRVSLGGTPYNPKS